MVRTLISARADHRIMVPLLSACLCLAFIPRVTALNRTSLTERFVAQAMSVSGPERTGPVEILINTWSSDAELLRLRDALQKADTVKLINLLHQQKRRVGVVLMPGVGGHGARARTQTPHNLVFARSVHTPSGRQVIAIADEHLGFGEPRLDARNQTPEFNLIDIRFGQDGTGVGKVVSAADITFNAKLGLLEATNFAAHPPRLVSVKTE